MGYISSEYIFEPKSFESAKNDDGLEIVQGRVNALRNAMQGVANDAKKWSNKARAHGWRKTFYTLATRNSARPFAHLLLEIAQDILHTCY